MTRLRLAWCTTMNLTKIVFNSWHGASTMNLTTTVYIFFHGVPTMKLFIDDSPLSLINFIYWLSSHWRWVLFFVALPFSWLCLLAVSVYFRYTSGCSISTSFLHRYFYFTYKKTMNLTTIVYTSFIACPFISESIWDKIKPATINFFPKTFTGLLIWSLSMGTRKYKTLESLRNNTGITLILKL